MSKTARSTPARILDNSIAESSSIPTGASRRRGRLAVQAFLAIGGLLATGNPGSAPAATLTYDLGLPGAGTEILGGNDGITWFSAGFLAAGSILQEVTINAALDLEEENGTWASDLNFYVNGLLRIGSDGSWPASVAEMDWSNGQDSAVGTTVIDTKTAGTDWEEEVDLSLATVYLRNGYDTARWSGSITITYEVAGPPTGLTWKGADGISPTQWSTALGVLNWDDGAGSVAYADGQNVIFDDSVGAGSRTVDISVADVAPQGVFFINSGANTYTLTGTNAITGTTKLTKEGDGLVILGTVNTYTGKTTISEGTLRLGVADALPHGSGKGNVVVHGTLDLHGLSPTLNGLTGAGTVTSGIAGPATLTLGDADTSSTFIGLIQDGSGSVGLTKTGTGTLTLTGLNTYTGKTTVLDGTLYLGIPNATGTGLTNAGVPGPLGAPLAGPNATIDLFNGTTLQTGDTNPRVNQETDRPINLAENGPGTVSIKVNDNDTSFTFGAVTATGTGAKMLALFTGARGNGDREELTFNGAISESPGGGPLSLHVTFTTQTESTSFVNLKEGGTFTGPISTAKGNIDLCTYYLTIGGRLAQASGMNFTSTPGSGTLGTTVPGVSGSYAGNISLDTDIILYYNSSAAQTLSGTISGAGSVTKAVAGSLLILTGPNTHDGQTRVTAGVLNIRHATALGTIVSGTSVTSGAALELEGGITVGSETLALDGTGVAAGGALRSISGGNVWRGIVTLGGPARINSDAGSLTFESGGINGTNTSLTIGGAGDTTIAAPVAIGAAGGALTKDGAGLLNIDSGAQTYKTLTTTAGAGTTNVNVALTATGGTDVIANGNLKFGSVSQELSSLTIGAGATVTFTSGTAMGAFGSGGKPLGLGGAAVVPEPGSFGLLLAGALGALGRRRRKG